jgi:hypothetical protein
VLQCGHQCKFSSLSTTHSTWTKACSHLLVTTWRASTRATQTVSSRWEQTLSRYCTYYYVPLITDIKTHRPLGVR